MAKALKLMALVVFLAGCKTVRLDVEGEKVVYIRKGDSAPYDGYLVTPVLMARVLEKLRE